MGLTAGSKALLVLSAIGGVILVIGCVFIPVFKNMIRQKINNELPLKNGSESFKTWEDPPAPIYIKFYVFDVVNAANVLANGSKPQLVEKGPYTYREVRTKRNVSFTQDGTRLSYREAKNYIFQADMSSGHENDTFTSINLPLLVLGMKFPSGISGDILRLAAEYFGERLLDNYTVHGYIWGYHDRHLKNLPILKDKDFGIFTGDKGNGTDDGEYVIYTGTDNITMFNNIFSWKGEKKLSWWNSAPCNMINGTDGTMWHPFIEKTETLYLFSSQICRSIFFNYNNTYKLKGKVDVMRFLPPHLVFADNKTNPDNTGFCPDAGCLKSGVLDISKCSDGVPIVMSLPHFYQADPAYLHAVLGLTPNTDKHSTLIDLEPTTGATFNAHKRLQINAQIHHVNSLSDSAKLEDGIIFPILWLDEGATISSDGLATFQREVSGPILLTIGIQYGLIGLGGLILLCVLGAFLIRFGLSRRTQQERGLLSDVAGDE